MPMFTAQACRLYARAEQRKGVTPEQLSAVVQAFARIVYVHICLLLETDAQVSVLLLNRAVASPFRESKGCRPLGHTVPLEDLTCKAWTVHVPHN
jgi:hypothetical protein